MNIVGPQNKAVQKESLDRTTCNDNDSLSATRSINVAARDLMKKYLDVRSKEKRNVLYNQNPLESFVQDSNASKSAKLGSSTIKFGSSRTKYDVR